MKKYLSVLFVGVVLACIYAVVLLRPQPLIETKTAENDVLHREGFQITENVRWPVPGSAPTTAVVHSVPLQEIKQGCRVKDCIPSVDAPVFMDTEPALQMLGADALGIALSYNQVHRFYPFAMLETHELVNDRLGDDALLISYCPLCGTGIVFDRTLDGEVVAFGVSGMLWQSNLLMYNRSASVHDMNLWSQVLGEAVVGDRTGQTLVQVPSDIMRLGEWAARHTQGQVLTTGSPQDPYGGAYYQVAKRFAPNFDPTDSQLLPMEYVYGIDIDGVTKAYPAPLLTEGVHTDIVNGVTLTIVKDSGVVTFTDSAGETIPDVEGFWFSWKAAHPDTDVWINS